MCIRDSKYIVCNADEGDPAAFSDRYLLEQRPHLVLLGMMICLLYTSDAADERSSVDLGGRRIIKKKQHEAVYSRQRHTSDED